MEENNIEIDLTDFVESTPPKIPKTNFTKNDTVQRSSEITKVDLTSDNFPDSKESEILKNDIAEEILGETSEFTCSFKCKFSILIFFIII